MTAASFTHRVGLSRPIVGLMADATRCDPTHHFRQIGPVSRPGLGVTRPQWGVSSLALAGHSFGGGRSLRGGSDESRCRAPGRCISQHVRLSRGGVAAPSLACLRSNLVVSRPVSSGPVPSQPDALRKVSIGFDPLQDQSSCLQITALRAAYPFTLIGIR